MPRRGAERLRDAWAASCLGGAAPTAVASLLTELEPTSQQFISNIFVGKTNGAMRARNGQCNPGNLNRTNAEPAVGLHAAAQPNDCATAHRLRHM